MIPTYVLLTLDDDGIASVSAVNLDNIQTIQKDQIGALITTLTEERLQEVERSLCFALGMDRFID
jgi:mRNA-degrading endonuclease toxin of MazEF toxin-antitoxin module